MTTNIDSEMAIHIIYTEIIYAILICQLPHFNRENLPHLVVVVCLVLMLRTDHLGMYLSVVWSIFFWNNLVKNAFDRYERNIDYICLLIGMKANYHSVIPRLLNTINEMLPPNFKILPANNSLFNELQQLLATHKH